MLCCYVLKAPDVPTMTHLERGTIHMGTAVKLLHLCHSHCFGACLWFPQLEGKLASAVSALASSLYVLTVGCARVPAHYVMVLPAGGNFGNGGGKGPSKKELDEFGEDEDNMLGKAEVLLCTTIDTPQAQACMRSWAMEAGLCSACQMCLAFHHDEGKSSRRHIYCTALHHWRQDAAGRCKPACAEPAPYAQRLVTLYLRLQAIPCRQRSCAGPRG